MSKTNLYSLVSQFVPLYGAIQSHNNALFSTEHIPRLHELGIHGSEINKHVFYYFEFRIFFINISHKTEGASTTFCIIDKQKCIASLFDRDGYLVDFVIS